MKKVLMIFACMALCASLASAVTCASLAGTDVNPSGNTTSVICTNGPLTFSSFAYANNLGDPSPIVSLSNPQPGNVGSDFFLGLNPNLLGPAAEDLHLIFLVSGANILQVSLNNSGGQLSSITEHVCSSAGGSTALQISNFEGSGDCTQLQGGLQVGVLTANDGVNVSENIIPTSNLWVWKDIGVASGGHNSAFTQDFLVPEPATLLLIGGGLAALGVIRRRKKA
jgi:hypothetical protein